MTSYRTSLFTSYICSLVMNKNYGKGKIHSITNGIITVQFEKVGFKKFGVGANEKNNMLAACGNAYALRFCRLQRERSQTV